MNRQKPHSPRVVVLGDITVDVLAHIPGLPNVGEDCLVPKLELHCGGVGANTAIALSNWGVGVTLLGCIGRDSFGEIALDFLKNAQVDIFCIQRTDRAMTGLMYIAVNPDGQRTIFGSRGANAVVTSASGPDCVEGAQGAHLVGYSFLSSSVGQFAEQILETAHQQDTWVSLDVGMAASREIPEKILQLARKVDILFVSLDETIALTGKRDRFDAFQWFEPGSAPEIVMKLGAEGCMVEENGAIREVPGFSVAAVDTTGAGDAFAAAFLRARLHNWPAADAALLANAGGAAAACVMGAGEAMPAPREILRVLRSNCLPAPWDEVRVRVIERLHKELGSEPFAHSSGGQK